MPAMIVRSVVVALLAVLIASGPARGQESCIGQHSPTGMEFSGNGSMISDPFFVSEGALFAQSEMSAAGAIQIMNATGDTRLLRNSVDAGPLTEAISVYESGEYYLVVDFFSDEGSWSLTIEQPSA